jgi:transposase-like protein
VVAVISDKQHGLEPAVPAVFPHAKHGLCESHYLKPGLFHCYDVPGLPRTNNDRESEFRDLNRRLLATTGQKRLVKLIIRLHTRSAKLSQAQLKQLVQRWKALPPIDSS